MFNDQNDPTQAELEQAVSRDTPLYQDTREEFKVPPDRHYGMTWKEKLGDAYGKPGLRHTIPDYVVADIKNLKKTENTTLRQVLPETKFPLSHEDMEDIARLKWKFENDASWFSLSSPQLGLKQRAMMYHIPTTLDKIKLKDKKFVYTLINPTYEPVGDGMWLAYEKCHSVKDVCALVYRFSTIRVKAYLPSGEYVEREENGAIARFIQHEIDHMNGILFTDQAAKIITIKEHNWRRKVGKIIFFLGA